MKNSCDSRCCGVPRWCEQLFFHPTSLPDRWQILSPRTSQPSLSCIGSQHHVPGRSLHIYPLKVWLPFAVIEKMHFLGFHSNVKTVVWYTTFIWLWWILPQKTHPVLVWSLTPSWILTVLEHVVPVVPHGMFSVITPKLSSAVLLPHLFFKERNWINIIAFFPLWQTVFSDNVKLQLGFQ